MERIQEDESLILNFIEPLFLKSKDFGIGEIVAARNYIAHLNHLNKKPLYSIIDLANKLIKIFEYDRKIKNKILESIKTILAKYNMDISFKYNDDKTKEKSYTIDEITSKQENHLGGKVFIDSRDKEFRDNVKLLLSYNDSNTNDTNNNQR